MKPKLTLEPLHTGHGVAIDYESEFIRFSLCAYKEESAPIEMYLVEWFAQRGNGHPAQMCVVGGMSESEALITGLGYVEDHLGQHRPEVAEAVKAARTKIHEGAFALPF